MSETIRVKPSKGAGGAVVSVRLSKAEAEQIARAAELAGVKLSTYLRLAALEASRPTVTSVNTITLATSVANAACAQGYDPGCHWYNTGGPAIW